MIFYVYPAFFFDNDETHLITCGFLHLFARKELKLVDMMLFNSILN